MASYGQGYNGSYQNSSQRPANDSSSTDFNRLQSSIASNIQRIAQNTSRQQRLVQQIGTTHDSGRLTGELQQLQSQNNELVKTTNEQLKNLAEVVKNSPAAEKRQRQLQKERLTDDFTKALNLVQKTQREAADKERESVRKARANSASSNPFADGDDYGTGINKSQLVSFDNDERPQQKSMQAIIDEEENLSQIREREAALKNLERDILDVNQIFKDIGQLVHEQGDMIDSIESNVESAVVHVEQANVQLTKASEYQSSARRKKCICAIILVVALVVLILVITIPIVVNKKPSS